MVFSVQAASTLDAKLEALIQQEDYVLGLEVRDMATGEVLFQKMLASQLMKPASLQKIPASLVALKHLGEKYTFRTSIGYNNRDVFVHFMGDPTFCLTHLVELFKIYKKKQGNVIRGNIYINRIQYPAFPHQDGWSVDSARFLYGALISNININNNSVCVRIVPPKSCGKNTEVVYDADQPPYKEINAMHIGKCNDYTRVQRQDCQFDGKVVSIKGCVPFKSNPFRVCLPIKEHQFEAFVSDAIKAAVKEAGLSFSGKVLFKPFDRKAIKVVSVHHSAPLAEMLKIGMKDSKNVVMEGLMVPIAMARPFYFRKESALDEFLKAKIKEYGLGDLGNARLSDMSGLSHHNLLSPAHVGQMLWHASRCYPCFSLWKETFALGGEDGTVSKRLKKAKENVKVYAKTGTLLGVSNIAGYIEKNGQKTVSFVLMMQNFTKEPSFYKELKEKIIYYLAHII
ncbi:MAG: D-alanyl-D-alanine carboxypeptidase/D-alanyl-D-alanine-endopeptidase [Holosporaceae bacterium]|nr:MAG: D-alanyl-D-alanine carboxypeptidase/D-alanyl-D-alanine-endopeptidase [Holosporaceae bacterium]